MPVIKPSLQQLNPLNQLPTLESTIVGGAERAVFGFLFPSKNPQNRVQPPLQNQQFNIQKFVTNLHQHNETARTDKFDVIFTLPSGLLHSGYLPQGISMKDLNLQCEVSELPGRDIGTVDYHQSSFIQRMPHLNQYGQASFTFIVTGDMWEKKLLDTWMDFMIPSRTGLVNYALDSSGRNNWETDIQCNQYDSAGQLAYQAILYDALPTSISPLNQSWDNDSIHRLNVTFQFKKWNTIDSFVNHAAPFSAHPLQGPSPPGFISTVANALIPPADARVLNDNVITQTLVKSKF